MAQKLDLEPVQKLDLEPLNLEPDDNEKPVSKLLKGGLFDPNLSLKDKLLLPFKEPTTDSEGFKISGPGLMKIPGLESLGSTIQEKASNTGNYLVGAAGGLTKYLTDILSTGFDPRTAGIKPVEAALSELKPVGSGQTEAAAAKVTPKLLGPAPPQSRFVSGERGIADATVPNKIDLGPQPQNLSGTVPSSQFGQVNTVPPEIAASYSGSGSPARLNPIEPSTSTAIGPVGNETPKLNPINEQAVQPKYNVGAPELPYQLPSAERISKIRESASPEIKNGDIPAPPLDDVVQKTTVPKTAEESVLPKPGNPDISAATAEFTSPNQTLGAHPETAQIAELIPKTYDQKTKWIATTQRELADISSGLNKVDRITLGKLIDGQTVEGAPLELQARANKARPILDQIHEMFPEGATKAGKDVGYLENYFTHIEEQPGDIKSAIKSILDYHFGIFKAPEFAGGGNVYDVGMGNPSSRFVEPRTGALKDVQYDVNKVFPAYVESAARVIYDKPAIQAAAEMLKDIPDSNLKELATWYVRNYSNFDSLPGLSQAWSGWASKLARTTSRSLLGFNTGLQSLHLARIPANLWPELGTKYTAMGMKQLATHPIEAWTEAAKLGLLQNEIRPFAFKTTMEKFDSVSNFLSLADYLDKSIGYHGFKQKFIDMGMNESDASMKALAETKRVSLTTDPARQMKGFSPEGPMGPVGSKLTMQFKQVPAKIVEQFTRIAMNAKNDKRVAARLVAGNGLAIAGLVAGVKTFHLNPMNMLPDAAFGPFGDVMKGVTSKLAGGDATGALMDLALWAIPGGKSIQRQIEGGPSAFVGE